MPVENPASSRADEEFEIFICYPRKNAAIQSWLLEVLASMGASVWSDRQMPPSGWEEELAKRIRLCRTMVIIWTAHTAMSKVCARELRDAGHLDKSIIPLWFEDHPITDGFRLQLGSLHRVNYHTESDIDANRELYRLLRLAGIRCHDNVDFTLLKPWPRPAGPSAAGVVAEPAAEHESASRPTRMAGEADTFRLSEMLPAVFTGVDEVALRFFSAHRSPGLNGAVPGLLASHKYAEAAALADEEVKQTMGLEPLRLSLIANLAAANGGAQSAAAAAHAAMCLGALSCSDDLWRQGGVPEGSVEQIIELALEALRHVAESEGPLRCQDDLTGPLDIPSLAEAERESARALRGEGGVAIQAEGGPRCMAYGWLFARHYGRKWELERQALRHDSLRRLHYFSPLFAWAFLKRSCRCREVIEHPPEWVTPHSDIFDEAARLVGSCAVELIESLLHPQASREDLALCDKALDRLKTFRPAPGADAAALDASLKKALERFFYAVRNTWQSGPVGGIPSDGVHVFEHAVKFLGENGTSLDREFHVWLGREGAKAAAIRREWDDALTCLAIAEEHGHTLSANELEWRFRGWLGRFACNDPEALERAKETLQALRERAPGASCITDMDVAVAHAEQIARSVAAPPAIGSSAEMYRLDPSQENGVQLICALHAHAAEVLEQQGATVVVDLMKEMIRQFPDVPGMKEMAPQLVREWENRFPDADLGPLVHYVLGDLQSPAPPHLHPHPPPTGEDVASALGCEQAGQSYMNLRDLASKVQLLAAIQTEATELMEHQGPECAAEFLHAQRAKFSEIKELASLPTQLQKRWLGRFEDAAILAFLTACAPGIPGRPSVIRVQNPAAPIPADDLLERQKLAEERYVRQRLEAFQQEPTK